MNKKILAIAIGSALSAGAQAAITDIIITEYVEGTSNNKAIELTNTGASYTFTATDTLQYSSYDNVIFNAAGVNVLEGITIAANETIVIANGSSGTDLTGAVTSNGAQLILTGTYGEVKYNSANFNGGDHVALFDGTTLIDIIGRDSDWGANKTFRRRLGTGNVIPVQSSSYNSSEWEEFGENSFADLGNATYSEYQEQSFVCVKDTKTTIAEVQGAGSSSPLITSGFESAAAYDITGIVTAVTRYPVAGFYIQDVTADGYAATSDGIFVKTSNTSIDMVGNTICLNSTVTESYGLTQLETDQWDTTDTNYSVPYATDIVMIPEDKGSFEATLERYEGMLVNLPTDIDPGSDDNQDMRVSKTFGFNYDSYRNDMILSYQRPNMIPTQNNVAGSDAASAYAAQNDDYRLIVESSEKANDGEIPYYPTFNIDAADNYIRIDDSVIGMEGVITYSYGDFNLVVTNDLDKSNFIHNTDRTSSPKLNTATEDGHFAIKIGTQNVLNLFNSPFGGDYNSHGENRGADDYDEYQKQQAKLVAAIKGLDADIVGLMEIENNGFGSGSAVRALVDALNEQYYDEDPKDAATPASTSNRYVFIGYDSNGDMVLDELDSIGSDAISTGLLYRPTKVSIDSMKVIPMPQQHAPFIVNDSNIVVKDNNGAVLESGNNYQRDTLAATFIVNQTGKRLTVAVNHLKSKGSTCWEDWQGVEFGEKVKWTADAPDADLQGSCENFRVAAAVQLGEELKKMGGDSVIVGDLNAYGQEDPLLVLTENATAKSLITARDTFIGNTPQFNTEGTPVTVDESFGYINTVSLKDVQKGQSNWSYSYNDEIGSLDHILISPSLKSRLIDAVNWHINAAESPLYDYNTNYKGTHAYDFYVDDAYRSSDHDPAIISLSYQYGEASNDQPVQLVISNGLTKVPYLIPDSEGALAGDITQISLSSATDMSEIVLPTITLTENGQSFVDIEVFGIKAGTYNATMTLIRDSQVMPEFTVAMKIEAEKQNSITAKITPPAAYDGSGGSLGAFGLISLLGFGFLRHRKAK